MEQCNNTNKNHYDESGSTFLAEYETSDSVDPMKSLVVEESKDFGDWGNNG